MKLTLISDFNIGTLGRFLTAAVGPDLAVETAPYNQVHQTIQRLIAAGEPAGGSLVWVQPQGVIQTYRDALSMKPYELDRILSEVREFGMEIVELGKRQRCCLVASWGLPFGHRGYGLLDWRPDTGLSALLARMNLCLAETVAACPNAFLLDASRWAAGQANPAPPKLWFAAKMPNSAEVFKAASHDIVRALEAVRGGSRKILLLDLDNTLWGGIVGETGWQELRVGGHDHLGEAFKAFQEALKALTRRGVQLGIVSKNDERTALEAVDRHPEMALRRSDFAGWRINWRDKAQNISELLGELRLGASSAVFIDDNPAERERVRNALPEILVPEWPEDPALYERALHELACFDSAALSREDRERSTMYVAERERREGRAQSASLQEWLAGLKTRATVQALSDANLPRITQLFNKTNQFNLSTRRLGANEISEWGRAEGREILAFSVQDKFGDMGLCGVVGLEKDGAGARLSDFILSCRAMGRGIENAMLHVALDYARHWGARTLTARYLPTDRNGPTLEYLRGLGGTESADRTFTWDCGAPRPQPAGIDLIRSEGVVVQ